ncbi:hypothetical protein [Marinospirillum perlucidum]|uniref:hypothetical protein n=1 Tax=Marinospirillum perlucidum TaxID=1982602 RepID=UPI000DF36E9C|nr:hypothetical protein [Marinospirillum perlucidum]
MNQQAANQFPEYTTDLLNTTAAAANDQHLQIKEVLPLEYRLNNDRIDLQRVHRQVRAAKAQLVRQFFARLLG